MCFVALQMAEDVPTSHHTCLVFVAINIAGNLPEVSSKISVVVKFTHVATTCSPSKIPSCFTLTNVETQT